MAMATGLPAGAWAQEAATNATGTPLRLPFTVVPSVSASQTFTRNSAQSGGAASNELVTQFSPGVRIDSGSGPLKGFLYYSLNALAYARESRNNNVQHALNAALTAEVVPNWLSIDTSASISQQSTSAFGQQFDDRSVASPNRSEVRSYSVSPHVRGTIGGAVDYDARVSHSASGSSASTVSDNATTTAIAQFNGSTNLSSLGWAVTASHQAYDFSAGRNSESDRVDASLSYQLTPQLSVSANAGRESSNLTTFAKESFTTSGIGAFWRPSERTSLAANIDHREFGDTHSLSFSHRTGRTVWTYIDTRSVTTGVGQPVLASLGTAYDLVFQQRTSQPDLDLRRQEVLALLLASGIDPTQQVIGSFLTAALSLERRQAFSAVWLGLRDSVTFSVSRSASSRLDKIVGVTDDFSTSGTIRQQGFALTLAHRLTPTSALTLGATQLRTSGVSTAPSTRFRSIDLGWTDQIGRRTRAAVTARHGKFDVFSGSTAPYAESALTASLSLTF